jgi:type IV secretory pathway TraG/TraD family ATPase VirD4
VRGSGGAFAIRPTFARWVVPATVFVVGCVAVVFAGYEARIALAVTLPVAYLISLMYQTKDPHIRGRRLEKFIIVEKMARRRMPPGDAGFIVGGVPLPKNAKHKGFFILGEQESGKSLSISLLMAQAFGKDKPARGVIFDPKNKAPNFLSALGVPKEKVRILNPLDRRCVGWDIQADIPENPKLGLMIAREIARLFVPERENEGDGAYFTTAARELMGGVLQSLYLSGLERKRENHERRAKGEEELPPYRFTLRDVVLALKDKEAMREVLAKHQSTLEVISYLDKDKNKGDIITTVIGFFKRYQELASIWADRELISFRRWKEDGDGEILIFGGDREAEEELNNLNRMMIHRLTQLVTTGDVTDAKETWFFLDEFAQLGRIEGFHNFVPLVREYKGCVVIATQNIEQMRHYYGGHLTNVIFDDCATKVFLKCSGETARFASERIGNEELIEESEQEHYDTLKTRQGVGRAPKLKAVVIDSEFASLPVAGEKAGVPGFYLTSFLEGVVWYRALKPQRDLLPVWNLKGTEPGYQRIDSGVSFDDPKFSIDLEWTDDDRERLGLSPRQREQGQKTEQEPVRTPPAAEERAEAKEARKEKKRRGPRFNLQTARGN